MKARTAEATGQGPSEFWSKPPIGAKYPGGGAIVNQQVLQCGQVIIAQRKKCRGGRTTGTGSVGGKEFDGSGKSCSTRKGGRIRRTPLEVQRKWGGGGGTGGN